MADYIPILEKAINGLSENTAENRQIIYQKARAAIDRKLRSMEPQPPESAIAEQMAQLENAISQVEGEHQLAAAFPEAETVEPSPPVAEPVQPAAPEPVFESAPVVEPIPAPNPPEGFIDDIILIDGIGEKTRENLADEGITGISQVAAMSDASLAALTAKLGIANFEVNQEWKKQASEMLAGELPRSKTDQDRLKKLQEAANPIPAPNPPEGFVDDVILIDGIGEKTQASLAAEGITGISQIAAISETRLGMITEKIGVPNFQNTQEWKTQAGEMLSGQLPRSKTDQERLKQMRIAAGYDTPQAEAEPAPDIPAPFDVASIPEEEPLAPPPPSIPTAPEVVETPATVQASLEPEIPEPFESEAVTTEPVTAQSIADSLRQTIDDGASGQGSEASNNEPLSDEEIAIANAIKALASEDQELATAQNTFGGRPTVEVQTSDPAPDFPAIDPEPRVESSTMAAGSTGSAPPYVSELEGDPLAPSNDAYRSSPAAPAALKKKSGAGKTIGCLAGLLLLGGAAYGAWLNQDLVREYANKGMEAVQGLMGNGEPVETIRAEPETQESSSEGNTGESGDTANKDTSRLGSGDASGDTGSQGSEATAGSENTPAPENNATEAGTDNASENTAGDSASTEEAPTSIIDNPIVNTEEPGTVEVEGSDTATDTGNGDSAGNDSSGDSAAGNTVTPAVVSGEKAYLYEEALGASGASRDEGGIVWSLANEAPEAGAEPEPVIKGVVEIPARGLTLNMSIKRNVDPGLPASHLIELLFTAPPDFSGGNVDNVSRFVMKATEQARGESLVGVPARIDTGFFLIALNNLEQARQTNVGLLQNANWIDIPVAYVTGRRGLITFEKGEAGKRVFEQALADWANR